MRPCFYLLSILMCLLIAVSATVCSTTSYSTGGSGSETPNVLNAKKKPSQVTENDSFDLLMGGGIDTVRGNKTSPALNEKRK